MIHRRIDRTNVQYFYRFHRFFQMYFKLRIIGDQARTYINNSDTENDHPSPASVSFATSHDIDLVDQFRNFSRIKSFYRLSLKARPRIVCRLQPLNIDQHKKQDREIERKKERRREIRYKMDILIRTRRRQNKRDGETKKEKI